MLFELFKSKTSKVSIPIDNSNLYSTWVGKHFQNRNSKFAFKTPSEAKMLFLLWNIISVIDCTSSPVLLAESEILVNSHNDLVERLSCIIPQFGRPLQLHQDTVSIYVGLNQARFTSFLPLHLKNLKKSWKKNPGNLN